MNNQKKPLSKAEQKEYDRLLDIYKAAGGNPENPLDQTTIKLFRGEKESQPENSITPEQIDELRELYKKRINDILPK